MREQERLLRQDIERCVDILQNIIDTEATRSISIFSNKTTENAQWLEEIKQKFVLRDGKELEKFQELKDEQMNKLTELEGKVDYYERLCDELEEFQNELEIKTKLEQKRRSKLSDT